MNINELINGYLRIGSGDEWCSSAVTRERGSTYVNYDCIRIGNASDVVGGVSLQFLWKGVAVAWVRLPNARLAHDVFQATEQLSGRLKI
jgi:hypothetical protein